jgi:small subunit ribosomal protein S2
MSIKQTIERMFSAGAHFGLGRSRRHPTITPYVFGTKNKTDIFDLEKTHASLDKAKAFVTELAKDNKTILFVGGKKESSFIVKTAAQSLNMPFVDGRWIGGTISNFPQIRKRIERYEKLVNEKEKGELAKYTKRERMIIDKEILSLEKMFLGIVTMNKVPDAMFIIDPRYEKNAIKEAQDHNIPVIALSSSDCDIKSIQYPIIGNDSSKTSISFFAEEIVSAYRAGKVSTNK